MNIPFLLIYKKTKAVVSKKKTEFGFYIITYLYTVLHEVRRIQIL